MKEQTHRMEQQWRMEQRRWWCGWDWEQAEQSQRPAWPGRDPPPSTEENKGMDEQLPGKHSISATFWQRMINLISTYSNCYLWNYFPPLPPLCDLHLHLLILFLLLCNLSLLMSLSGPFVSDFPPSTPTGPPFIPPTICLSFPFQPFLLSGL